MKYTKLKKVSDIKIQIEKQVEDIESYMEDLKRFSILLALLYKKENLLSFVDFVYLGRIVVESLLNLDDALFDIEKMRLELNSLNPEQFIELSKDELYLLGFIESSELLKTINEIRVINDYEKSENPIDFACEHIQKYFLK